MIIFFKNKPGHKNNGLNFNKINKEYFVQQ